MCNWCPGPESNRHEILYSRDFKSLASTCFATWAYIKAFKPYTKAKLTTDASTLVLEAEAGIEPASAALQAAA